MRTPYLDALLNEVCLAFVSFPVAADYFLKALDRVLRHGIGRKRKPAGVALFLTCLVSF